MSYLLRNNWTAFAVYKSVQQFVPIFFRSIATLISSLDQSLRIFVELRRFFLTFFSVFECHWPNKRLLLPLTGEEDWNLLGTLITYCLNVNYFCSYWHYIPTAHRNYRTHLLDVCISATICILYENFTFCHCCLLGCYYFFTSYQSDFKVRVNIKISFDNVPLFVLHTVCNLKNADGEPILFAATFLM